MTEDDSSKPERRGDDPAPDPGSVTPEAISTQRVFKKSSSNNKLTIYLGSRDVIITNRKPEKIRGVILLDPEYLQDRKVYGQITLTFRYGREDEEVMGLKFCNEAIMTIAQLYPKHERSICEPTTPLQEALLRRLGPNAYPFSMEVTPLAPPSVQLVPAKEYNGAPIGTSYDVRAYLGGLGNEDDVGKPSWDGCLNNPAKAHRPDEKVNRRTMVRMGIRVLQIGTSSPVSHLLLASSPIQPGRPPGLCPCPPSNDASAPSVPDRPTSLPVLLSAQTAAPHTPPMPPPPQATAEKPFLLSDGKVKLDASLNKAIYSHGEAILVNINVRNHSNKSVRRIKVFVVQHVDVCMFSNGKFKNVVAMSNHRESPPLGPGGSTLNRVVALHPARGATKNWIALEDSLGRAGYGGTGSGSISAPSGVSGPLPSNSTVGRALAASVSAPSDNPEDRNVFAIYVSYYVKVKLLMGPMGGEVSVKLPFVLTHSLSNLDASSPAHPRSVDRSSAEIPVTPPPQPKVEANDTATKTEPSTSAIQVIQHDPPDSVKSSFPAATSSQAVNLKSTKNQELLKGADVILKCDDPDTS